MGSQRNCLILLCALGMSAAQAGDDVEQRQQRAAAATKSLVQQLGGALKKEMEAGGPAQAIGVCRDLAPKIAGELSRENGWRVTRVGTRVRNPLLGTPDAWEQQVLKDFQVRAAGGEAVADMSFSAVVEEPDGRYFRFMKAIPLQAACLNCHGPAEKIASSVQEQLASHYPMDRAVGYREGELRGAVSIKQPLDLPLKAN
ncbi:MAG TPA: DUF3365 domain-containing protein [Gammaproteobacteria bacterium]|nr:DUF3365 domain-containing protein [Gammaproteobacteria bacterium]